MFRVNSLMSALGVALMLIALYLILTRATSASRVVGQVGNTTNQIFRTLQGR